MLIESAGRSSFALLCAFASSRLRVRLVHAKSPSRKGTQRLMDDNDKSLREHVTSLLDGGNAHITFDDFVKDFPVDKCGERVDGLPYSAWQVLEHMRIAQWDILEFTRDANHVSPNWPKGYWPDEGDTGTEKLWSETVEKFRRDLEAF